MLFKLNIEPQKLKYQAAFTLLELTIVVLIIGVMTAVMIPRFSSTNPVRLENIAEQYASAMRFTRSEAIRTGKPYGFRQILVSKRMQVARMDVTTSPWSLIFDVYHPVSKKLYDFNLDNIASASDIILTRSNSYSGTCNNLSELYFDKNGSAWCTDPHNVTLQSFNLTLSAGTHSKLVSIDGLTGRVTVQ